MLTPQNIIPFVSEPPLRHKYYKDSVDMYEDLKVHSDGVYPCRLLDVARPNEESVYKEYRKDVYEPITKTFWGKILNTLAKIRRAEDFDIDFKSDTSNGKAFKEYCTQSFPIFDSIENWFFTFGIKTKCNDANGVYAVIPLEKQDINNDTELWRPFVVTFNSPQVLMFKQAYCILEDCEKSKYQKGDVKKEGKIIHAIDTEVYQKYDQTNETDSGEPIFTLVREIVHNFGYMPAFKVGGKINEFESNEILYDSHIADCMPFWNEAIRRYSDHQVNMVLHLHPDAWEIADSECPTCKGKGKITEIDGKRTHTSTCGRCNGGGNVTVKTPFGRKIIRPAQQVGVNGTVNIPTPPMGYANRDIDSIAFLKQEYKDDIRDGLAAINLENLMNEPMVNSGVAKVMDKQEQEAFLYDFFRDCVFNNLTPIYYFCAKWMFGATMSEEEIMKLIPVIELPQNFSIINSDALALSVRNSIDGKFNPLITANLELQYAKKEMGEESLQVLFLENMLILNPLPNKTVDEKLADLTAKVITQEAYIISENLYSFLVRANESNKKFFELPYYDKMKVIEGYANEIVAKNKAVIIPIQ